MGYNERLGSETDLLNYSRGGRGAGKRGDQKEQRERGGDGSVGKAGRWTVSRILGKAEGEYVAIPGD